MPKYRIKESMACWVTWTREVVADNETAALEAHSNGEGEVISEEIGDNLDGYDRGPEIEEVA